MVRLQHNPNSSYLSSVFRDARNCTDGYFQFVIEISLCILNKPMYKASNIVHIWVRYIVFSMYLISLVLGSGVHLHGAMFDDDDFVHDDEFVLHAHDSIELFQTHADDATLTLSQSTHSHSVAKVHLLASLTRIQNPIVYYARLIDMESCSDVSMETCKQLYLHNSDPSILQGITPDLAGRAPPIV
ncbi:MAG: hypothetical protein HYZ34_05935 [Ignavibacteriae bacterium]|nr:hypothetical protein [Ignavibacteriota bacterium]